MFFVLFIVVSAIIAFTASDIGSFLIIDTSYSLFIALIFIFINIIISAASLLNMKDSWRVGVIENQKTKLIENGIYKFSRNPYFLSYIFMFIAYTVMLQNIILFCLSVIGILSIHSMIIKEESYLLRIHGDLYTKYKRRVPRYFII
jgi:protein-S-isoprenylcysteine O-methyltransferase Ste14